VWLGIPFIKCVVEGSAINKIVKNFIPMIGSVERKLEVNWIRKSEKQCNAELVSDVYKFLIWILQNW
jgi:hypothetical protein